MKPDDLRERMLRGEDPHTEWKAALGSNEDLAKDLVCFANSDGGLIVLGIQDDRTVIGVDDPDPLLLRVDDVACNRCRPPVTVVPETLLLDDKAVVVVNVAKGDQRLYATASGRYYVRSGARCRAASREELLRLLQASTAPYYDDQPLPRLDLGDLDLDLDLELDLDLDLDLDSVTRHLAHSGLEDVEDLPRVLRNWRLYDGSHPTGGGVVLFGRAPQEALESSKVVAGAFLGDDIGDDLRRPCARQSSTRSSTGTTPSPARSASSCSPTAWRSARQDGHRTRWTPNAMRAGIHVTRNPHIYSRIADAELATRAGTGVRRIACLLREYGSRDLGIAVSDAEVVLTLPRGGSAA